eukprot:TRINITY_DN3541_c0_g1_i5.p3 TRINITY_DN3541_c0_g1~~TRINITY_DN3541_c0_g1_i5.p3  ORF type:complete len:357 (-),score=26.66 TRINITY_DN3541_c0_g1_i5:1024-2094(-)
MYQVLGFLFNFFAFSIQANLALQREQQEQFNLHRARSNSQELRKHVVSTRQLLQTNSSDSQQETANVLAYLDGFDIASFPALPEDNEDTSGSANETQYSNAFKGNGVSNIVPFETIVGEDDRAIIQNTYEFPYSAVGRLIFRCDGRLFACTGTLIGPATVLTSAHCIFHIDLDVLCYDFQFSPGKQRDYEPYGTVKATAVYLPDEFLETESLNYDYGVVILEQDIGFESGWMAFGYNCIETVQDLVTAGYPRDKDAYNSVMYSAECNEQSIDACPCTPSQFGICVQTPPLSNTFRHTCDTFAGQSGSAMWTYLTPDVPIIRAIHSAGVDPSQSSYDERNTAVFINANVYAFISQYV